MTPSSNEQPPHNVEQPREIFDASKALKILGVDRILDLDCASQSRYNIKIDDASYTPASDQHLLRYEEVCSRAECSRCWRQVVQLDLIEVCDLKCAGYTVAEATALCLDLANKTLALWRDLRYAIDTKMPFLLLEPYRLIDLVDRLMADMPSVWIASSHRGINQRRFCRENSTCGQFIDDDLRNLRYFCTHFLRERAVYHPAVFIPKVDAAMELDWEVGPEVHSARCFVRLDQGSYGKVQAIGEGGLHEDGVYTFSKAYRLLVGQHNLYVILHNAFRAADPEFDRKFKAATQQAQMILDDLNGGKTAQTWSPPPPPAMIAMLDAARSQCLAATEVVKNMIVSTIKSSESLTSDYKDQVAWMNRVGVGEQTKNEPYVVANAWMSITFTRFLGLSLLTALDADICAFRRAAHKRAKRKGTKVAMLMEWERLEKSLDCVLLYLSRTLFTNCHFDNVKDHRAEWHRNKRDYADVRQEVIPEQRLSWAILALLETNASPKERIQQFLDYIDFRRSAKLLFHWSSDFVVDMLKALRTLIDALETFQPFVSGVYPCPASANEGHAVRFMNKLGRLSRLDDFRMQWKAQTWTPFRLHHSINFSERHVEIWQTIFKCLQTGYGSVNIDGGLISQVLELRKFIDNSGAVMAQLPGAESQQPCSDEGPSLQAAAGLVESGAKAPQAMRLPEKQPLVVPSSQSKIQDVEAIQPANTPQRARVRSSSSKASGANPKGETTAVGGRPAVSGGKGQRQPFRAAIANSSLEDLGRSFAAFGLGSDTPKKSQWPEPEDSPKKNKQKTRKVADGSSPEKLDSEDNPAPEQATARIAFSDEKLYNALRTVIPSPSDGLQGGTLRWDDLCTLLTKEPLNFTVPRMATNAPKSSVMKFHREAQDGWPEGVITMHRPHGGPSIKVAKLMLDDLKKDLRKTFGWTADDFEFSGTGS